MATCKFILKEISKGSFCHTVKTHLADCPSCSALYREEIRLQEYLLGLQDVKPPHSLKLSILSELQKTKKHKHLWPTLQMAWRTAMLVSIIVIGYWLGIETANGNSIGNDNDPKINQSQFYPLITTPVDPSSLSEAYFKVVEEAEDEKK